jgi:Leucine-rich repeat (LRR) protein
MKLMLLIICGVLISWSYAGLNPAEQVIVREVLDSAGMTTVNVEDVVQTDENGWVTSLNLANPTPEQHGFTMLASSVGKLKHLTDLSLKDNSLDSLPSTLQYLTGLTRLDIQNNNLTVLPGWIWKLKKLTELDVRYNNLSDLSPQLFLCSNLKILKLWGNQLKTIPGGIVKLTLLKELYLSHNKLTDLPESITKISTLKYLDITDNMLCEPQPVIVQWLTKWDDTWKGKQKCR